MGDEEFCSHKLLLDADPTGVQNIGKVHELSRWLN